MGIQVDLQMPSVQFDEPQPPLRGNELRGSLIDLGNDLIPGSYVTLGGLAPNLVICLGEARESSLSPTWILTGASWMGQLEPPGESRTQQWTGTWPVGAEVAAALAAAEAFKYVLRGLPLKDSYYLRHLAPTLRGRWDFGNIATTASIDLGQVGFISAGAITQAALFTLLRLPGVQMRAQTLDDDCVGASNLNRNPLNRRSDIDRAKVDVLSEQSTPNVEVIGRRTRLTDATQGLPSRLLVGVDEIPARWVAQRQSPSWMGVSGTSHFEASSSEHRRGLPCAGCLHPRDDPATGPVPTVSFVSLWAGLALAVRLIRSVLQLPYGPEQQHLWLTPLRTEDIGSWSRVAARRDCPVGCGAFDLGSIVDVRPQARGEPAPDT